MDRLQKMFELKRNYNKMLKQKPFISDINSTIDENLTTEDIVKQQHNIIQYCIIHKINPDVLFQIYTIHDSQLKNKLD